MVQLLEYSMKYKHSIEYRIRVLEQYLSATVLGGRGRCISWHRVRVCPENSKDLQLSPIS